MSHPVQIKFCKRVRKLYKDHFRGKIVADIGSMDINGNNQYLFKRCKYIGIDVGEGKNVDYVGPGHEMLPKLVANMSEIAAGFKHKIESGSSKFDTIISTEALEHDKYLEQTMKTMYDCLEPGGLLLITCAGDGREEHGTGDSHAWASPFTNDYYKNVSNKMFGDILEPDLFRVYYLEQIDTDLQFYGIKRH